MEIMELRLDSIRPNPNNPRRDWGDLEALAASIDRVGLMSPLVVARDGKAFRLLAGERRWHAMRDHTLVETARCLVCDGMDEAAEAMAITGDNAYRKDFTDEEAARGVQQMLMLGIDELDVTAASGVDGSDVSAMETAVLRERESRRRAHALSEPPRQFTFYEARMLDYAWENGGTDEELDALLSAENMEAAYWKMRLRIEAEQESRRSEKSIEDSGAARVGWDEYQAMRQEGTCALYVHFNSITKKGCGCDGFSATIDPGNGRVTWFCAKPGNHGGEDPEQAARRLREEEWDEASAARRAFIVSKLNGANGGAQFTFFMQEQVAATFEREWARLAGEGNPDGLRDTFFIRCLARAWERCEANLYVLESESGWREDDQRRFVAYHDMLVGYGYEPGEAEAGIVEAVRERLAKADAAGA